jgi:hypothetical protein
MLIPPSLSQAVISRAFRAANGELGIMPEDASVFLDACQADRAEVLGWELWLIDHDWNAALNEPGKAPGHWCGLIPVRGEPLPNVVQGDSDLTTTRAELAKLNLNAIIEPRWAEHLRVNFTLAEA